MMDFVSRVRAYFSLPIIILLTGLIPRIDAGAAVNVTQFHNHLSRDGFFVDPAFTTANASNLTRDLNFNGAISGQVYAQPLYIEGGPGGRAVVIAVTELNNVYALDAFTGNIVWQTNVAPSIGSGVLPCGNISPYGITGTPVVDLPSRALFFDAVTQVSGTVTHLIFSLNVDTGALNPGWPVNVNNSAHFGTTNFVSLAQGERGALAVIGTNLYVPYGGLYGDCGSYYGWVVGVPLAQPANVFAWATAAKQGGIWGVGGIASDGTDPFVVTGNTDNPATWGGGNAVIHLTPGLVLNGTANYWAPTNWSSLDQQDLDLGGSGALLVTVPGATPSNLVVALGKDQNMYLLNRANLGGVTLPLAQQTVGTGPIRQAAVTYHTALGTYVVFQNGSSLLGYRLGAANPPTINDIWGKSQGGTGSPFVTSTDGTNNIMVWGIGTESSQRLSSFDGDTGTAIFTGGGANELMAGTHHFQTAIAARGRIYVGADNKIYAFKAAGQTVTSIALTDSAVLSDGGFQFSFTNVPGALCNVFAATNISTPFTNWSWLGEATEVSSGQFQFTDAAGAGRYYRVVSP